MDYTDVLTDQFRGYVQQCRVPERVFISAKHWLVQTAIRWRCFIAKVTLIILNLLC
jgi:hypothetical protein